MAFYYITACNSRYNPHCITGEFWLFVILFMIIILIAVLWVRRAIKMRQERAIECKKDDLNTVEKDLIKRFDALNSYNRAAGGA